MRRSTAILCLSIAAAVWGAAPVSAESSPAWLIFEEGKALFEQREFGRALQRFQEAVAAAGTMPEAEMAIGDVYREEGELGLARAQYEKAYNNKNSLAVPAARYDILYRLAGIYEDQEFYKLMEDTLLAIVADDANWGGAKSSRLRTQLENNYYSKGMNQVLKLYRFDPSFAQAAHAKLGWFYYRTGRFSPAVLHCLYAAIYGSSELARYLREHDVEWEFSTFEDLLGAAEEQKDLHQYVADVVLYRNLYYLAGSTYASMYPKLAQSLWRAASRSKIAGEFADLSAKQLKKPWIEPYLVPLKKAPAGK
jgi:tetratricopeptide (TPR) repeat protein